MLMKAAVLGKDLRGVVLRRILMLFMGWVEETCAGQHHWPQAHRMANSLHSFQGHVTETQ